MATALLVTCTATLLESAPFILAAAVLARAPLRQSGWMVPYLGCGCGAGPSARSLPAAAAAAAAFGPVVAVGRLCAAVAFDRLRGRRRVCCSAHAEDSVLVQLWLLLPIAAAGACFSLFTPAIFGLRPAPYLAFAMGALTAFLLAPCGIGAAGFAAALRTVMPAAAAGFLCVAGIFDVRAWRHSRSALAQQHDAFAYVLAALASGLVAAHGGAGMVHPRIAQALWPCAGALTALAYLHRAKRSRRLRIAPAIMFAGSMISVPPPQYHVTQTTIADAFAGERIDFTGVVTRTRGVTTLVRFAITCCRADAAPIVVRLQNAPRALAGWVHASGVLVESGNGFALRAQTVQRIEPPADPFVYR